MGEFANQAALEAVMKLVRKLQDRKEKKLQKNRTEETEFEKTEK